MVKTIVTSLFSIIRDIAHYLPPGLIMSVASGFIDEGAHLRTFLQEFLGSGLMIACTFSAGKWIGQESMRMSWTSHFLGVVTADYFAGGPHVNPAVSISMWALGKTTYTEAYVRIAAQMGGGLISFPIFHALSNNFGWKPFGGPEFHIDDNEDPFEPFISEFCATLLLMILIYTVNWEWNFGKYHYWIKQSLTAIGIRSLIEFFPTAGPAMNPMLATSWDVFGVGNTYEYPSELVHYFVYWVAPFLAAVAASTLYVIYAGGTLFGHKLPVGPIKRTRAPHRAKRD